MIKLYKILGLIAQTMAVLSWFGVMALHGTNVELAKAIAVLLVILASVMSLAYWVLSSGDYDSFSALFLEHPHIWMFTAVSVGWLVPALIIDPWYSFGALVAFAICYWASWWAEERYLETRGKTHTVEDDYPPF